MSAERLREMLSAATPGPWFARGEGAVETQDLRALVLMDDRSDPDDRAKAMATARLIALAPDAIELLADLADALRRQTDEYDEALVRESWPDAPILAIFDLLHRLDALCGDERA